MSEYISVGGLIFEAGFGNYDAWKLASPYDDYGEPEFECSECSDTGYLYAGDEDGEPAEPCPYCHAPATLDDLENLYAEEFG